MQDNYNGNIPNHEQPFNTQTTQQPNNQQAGPIPPNNQQQPGQSSYYNPPQYQPQQGMEPPPGYMQKSRIAAGILAILLGELGVHSFYLGNTSKGLTQLLVSLLTCGIGAIVMKILAIIEGVRILDGRITTDAYGIYLKD